MKITVKHAYPDHVKRRYGEGEKGRIIRARKRK